MRIGQLIQLPVFLALWGCGDSSPPAPEPPRPLPAPRPTPTPPGAVRIAAIFPTSGRYEASGRQSFDGVRLAVAAVNRANGAGGRRLFVAEYPTRSDVASTQEAARRAVAEGAVAIVGSNASLLSETVAGVAEARRVVMVSNVSTKTSLTLNRPHVFRTCYSNDHLAGLLARFCLERLGVKRVAVLQEVSRPYSKDLGDRFTAHYRALGGEIREWHYVARATDFTPQLDEIRRFAPAALFLPSSFDDATLVAMQLRAMHLRLTMIGGDSWANDLLFARGDPGRPAYHSDHWDQSPDNPFYRQYVQRHGRPPQGGRAALAHDAVLAVAAALQALGRPLAEDDLVEPGLGRTREALRKALAGVRFEGATGPIVFDEQGNARKPCFVFRVEGRRRKFWMRFE